MRLIKTTIFAIATFIFSQSLLFAGGQTYHKFARVTHSDAIYEYVQTKEPYEQCYEEQVRSSNPYTSTYDDANTIGLDTIIGATTGVIIGNQIGSGNGRTTAKIIGGIIGGAMANKFRNQYANRDDYGKHDDYELRTKCYTRYKTVQEKILTGYKNHFKYKGEKHFKISKKPLKRVRITHNISF